MAKTPVTNAQYAIFVRSAGYEPPDHWQNRQPLSWKQDHPVVNVSWEDAVAYCEWLSEVAGRTYRLPTEVEWEKAARGKDGRIYPWGNYWNKKLCNTKDSGIDDTSPLGAYPDGASPYGLLDMVGNVWEWCTTKWGKPYPYDVEEDEWAGEYFQGDARRVLRGGAFDVLGKFPDSRRYDYRITPARCSGRNWGETKYKNLSRGFRLVSPTSPLSAP